MPPAPARGRPLHATVLLLCLLVPPLVAPVAVAHGGVDDGHADVPLGGQADNAAFAVSENGKRQANPAIWKDLVVWQELVDGDRAWDIMGANLTTRTTFTIVGQTGSQTTPDIDRDIVVWKEQRAQDSDVVMMDLAQGRIRVLGATAADEYAPQVAWPYVVWMVRDSDSTSFAAYDLQAKRPVTIARPEGRVQGVSTYGGHIVWLQNNGTQWAIYDWTEAGDQPKAWLMGGGAVSGPSAGPAGIGYVAYADGFKAHFAPWGGTARVLDTKVGPHANVRVCQETVVWDQPADGFGAGRGVALWDLLVGQSYVFFPRNYRPDCTASWLVFEKLDERGDVSTVYAQDVRLNRPTKAPEVRIDPGQNGAIIEHPTEFTGWVIHKDPRRPLERIEAYVDGDRPVEAVLYLDETGTYRYRVLVDPGRFTPGEHRLRVSVSTDTGLNGLITLTFYAVNADGIERAKAIMEFNRYVPPEPAERGPLEALVHHYEVYSRFYNSAFLVIVVLVLVGWFLYRWWKSKPRGRPEFVR